MHYSRRLVISGKYFELYAYEKGLKRDFTRTKKKICEHEQMQIDYQVEEKKVGTELSKRKDSIARTRTQIRRIINSNMDFTKFTTLTFKNHEKSVPVANKHFNKFIMRLNYKYGNFKYISVIEFQPCEAVHYHFLSNLPYIEKKELAEIWKNGYVKINKIKHVDNLGAYVCKYLQKDMTEKRLFNKKKFFCSKNIEKPIEIYDDREIENTLEYYNLSDAKPEFENKFSNEFIGNVEYKVFKLKL